MEQGPRVDMKRDEVEISGGRTLYSYTFSNAPEPAPAPPASDADSATTSGDGAAQG